MSLSEREIVGPGYSAEPEVMTLVPDPQGDESHHGQASMAEAECSGTKLAMVGMVPRSTGGRKEKMIETGARAKGTLLGTKSAPRWCPTGLTKTQHRRVQKLRAQEKQEKKQETKRDTWFN
jgi:hypothetical protein